jgi:hypothetical protein
MPARPNGVALGTIARRVNREGLEARTLAGGLDIGLITRAIGTRDNPKGVLIVTGEGFRSRKQAAGTLKSPQKVRISQAKAPSVMLGNVYRRVYLAVNIKSNGPALFPLAAVDSSIR